jgi:predicted RNA-binding Zn ribbon-like protein
MDILALDFVNTEWFATHYHFRDMLLEPDLREDFLRKQGLAPDAALDPECVRALAEERAFLKDALVSLIENQRLPKGADVKLNRYLALSSGRREVLQREGRLEVAFQPDEKDCHWIMAEVAQSFVRLADMDAGRLRMCENPACRWFFYDETRSRTKRCCDATCASLVKVRRYRAGKKEADLTK